MASTATIAPVKRAIWAQTVSTRSTNATRIHAKMERLARRHGTTTNATVPTDIRASNAKTLSTGVVNSRAIMVRHACRRRINSNVNAEQDGREKCVTLKWFHVAMQQPGKVLTRRDCATMEHAKTSATRIDAIVDAAIPVHIAKLKSMNATHRHVGTVEFAEI